MPLPAPAAPAAPAHPTPQLGEPMPRAILHAVLQHLSPAVPPRAARQQLEPGPPCPAPCGGFGPWPARQQDDGTCGASEGYPQWHSLVDLYSDRAAQTYLRAGCAVCPKHRVGNYAGHPGQAGFEKVFGYNTIHAAVAGSPAPSCGGGDTTAAFSYPFGANSRTLSDYLGRWDITGLLVARRGVVLAEHYRHQRSSEMRFTSWSMAKSITSLLLGIAIDRGLIASLDDRADQYLPRLGDRCAQLIWSPSALSHVDWPPARSGGVADPITACSELGRCTLRHLSNMSSGVEVTHERDNPTMCDADPTHSQRGVVAVACLLFRVPAQC
jgi:hypothetical protein